ncbi:ribonuclease H-like domain-containing protein [Mycena sanguinolenta]|nr:ribonuclease H-like domain-containing protein [Mycena sanguinolenta]
MWDNIGLRFIQLAYNNIAIVIDLMHMRALPSQLLRILKSPNIIKAGAGLANDIKVLWDDLRINVNRFVDVGYMARLALCERNYAGGYSGLALKTCVEEILGHLLNKYQQKSDWSVDELTNEQIEYAALDAFASKRLHEHLNTLLVAKAHKTSTVIPHSWYTFNGKMGEPICINTAFDGMDMAWRPAECTWFIGGKFVGYWPKTTEQNMSQIISPTNS